MLDRLIAGRLKGHAGDEAIQAIPGVGKVLAAVFVAERPATTSPTTTASPPAGERRWPRWPSGAKSSPWSSRGPGRRRGPLSGRPHGRP